MMKSPKSTELRPYEPKYDRPDRMTRDELEFAWLASIYSEPSFCRESMLNGLDESMFKNHDYFYLGIHLLRELSYETVNGVPTALPEESIKQIMAMNLVSRLEEAFDRMLFMPSFYKTYSSEIEKRSNRKFDLEWNG